MTYSEKKLKQVISWFLNCKDFTADSDLTRKLYLEDDMFRKKIRKDLGFIAHGFIKNTTINTGEAGRKFKCKKNIRFGT